MAYRADIEIGVVGASRLKELQERITRLSRAIDDANVKTLIDRNAIQSISSYSEAVGRASRNLRETAIQLDAAGKASGDYAQAISQVVTALGQENAAQKIQNDLIRDEIELRRRAKLAASGIRETTQYGGPIGPGPASPVGTLAGQKSPVEERIRRTIQGRRDETDLQQALLRLEEKSAAELNKKVQAQDALVKGTQEVLELLAAQAQKSKFLAGTSGPLAQGPLAGAGAMGFPVALPLTKVEQKSLEINAKKQEILNRMATTRQQLAGLASNLQRLDQNSAVAIADANRNQKQLNRSKQEAVELAERELNISKQGTLLAGKFSPVGGAANIPGSPLFLQAQRERRASQLSGIALGGGFPLLFGGGPGAVLGGAAGGLVPGPNAFAAQIGLSAIGQQADMFVAAAAKTGVALTSTGKTLEFMREKALFSTTAVEDQAVALEEQGKVSELAKLLTQDLARSIGGEGVKALQELGDETNKLTQEWNILTAQLFALVAGPLRAFIAALNSVLGGITTENRLSTLRREATPAQQARLAQITSEERGGTTRNVRGGGRQFIAGPESTQVRQRILERAAAEGIVPVAPGGRVTSEDLRTITAPKPKTDRSAQEEARMQQRLMGLRMETQAVKQLGFIQNSITQAEIAQDDQLVLRLQGEQRNLEILQQYQQALVGVTDEREQQSLFQKAAADIEFSNLQTSLALQKAEAARVKSLQDTIYDLEAQTVIESRISDEARRQEEIEQAILKLKRDKKILTVTEESDYRRANKQLDDARKKTEQIRSEQAQLQALYQGIAGQIASGVGGAIDAVVRSTDNLGEALQQLGQDILTTIGKMLIFYGLAKAFGVLGGSDGAGIFSYLAAGFGGDTKALGFAEGGFVTGPTRAVIGEAGESEYIIPASKMRGAMNRYAAGARGSAVIPAGDGDGGMGGTATLAPGAIDVRYTVERINSVDYVTADQFQQGMQQAAQQGAAQGEQRTLRRLQMSTSTRKRLGM